VNGYLLDVNVLIALSWPDHSEHEVAQHWFRAHSRHGWATCHITQLGFVRLTTNPLILRRAVSPQDALRALKANTQHPQHRFWTSRHNIPEALARFGNVLIGHQQITDAYLLSLAVEKDGKLATFDRGIDRIAAVSGYGKDSVEALGADSNLSYFT
jgi:toxin-antitoxin system PIN domain toxin